MNREYLYIFLHLQRSGGTTINGHFYKNLKPEEEFIHVGSPWRTEKQKKKEKIIDFEKRSLNERKKAKVISGHLAYYGIHQFVPNKIPRYFTLIRDPADRLASHYNGRNWESTKKIPSFEEWYKARRKNETTHFYSSKFKGMRGTMKTPSLLLRINSSIPGGEKRIWILKSILKKFNYFHSKNKEFYLEEFKNAKNLLDLCWFVGILELDEDKNIYFQIHRPPR